MKPSDSKSADLKAAPEAEPIWSRPEPPRRPPPVALSRELIVSAALKLADSEGLEAVSFRKLGIELSAGPMRLYGYVETKEELLALMVDAVFGEILAAGPFTGDWREVLRACAGRTRAAGLAHPWFSDLLGGRPHFGPQALVYLEAVLAALRQVSPTIDTAFQLTKTFNAYLIGALRSEFAERRDERESGLSKSAWQQQSGPYLSRMIATGRFPTIGEVYRDATHPSAEASFAAGLDCLLAGISARLGADG